MTLFIGNNLDSIADAPGGMLAGFLTGTLAELLDLVGDTILGNDGNDYISAGDGDDTIKGGKGNDTINGMAGADTMDGGEDIDTYVNSSFAGDYIWNMTTGATNVAGETAINFENGIMGDGDDIVTGSAVNNIIVGGRGMDAIDGGGGQDTLRGNDDGDRLFGNSGHDVLSGGRAIDRLDGGTGNDRLYGGSEVDTLFGSVGNDTAYILNGEAADRFDGGADIDRLDLGDIAGWGARVNLSTGIYSIVGLGAAAPVLQTEDVRGTQRDDLIVGNGGNNVLSGLRGNDEIIGAGGDDTLNGGFGNDRLTGDGGRDSFQFDTAPNSLGNLDIITDFVSADDGIQLDNDTFIGLGVGPLPVAAFRLGPVAVDADDRIIYNPITGLISFDPTGAVMVDLDQVAFARVAPGTLVSAADFSVID